MKQAIKEKIEEARKSTKVAFIGGAVIVAGTWGSCQFQYDEHSEAENAPEAQEEAPQGEAQPSEVEEEAGGEEALQEPTE